MTMDKAFKTMLALMAGTMLCTACSKGDIFEIVDNQNSSTLRPMTFTASMEGQGGVTRATIDGLEIKWLDGDKISIFGSSRQYEGNQEFTLTKGSGTTSGTFEGNATEEDTYYALYPYGVLNESRIATEEEASVALNDAARFETLRDYMRDNEDWRYDSDLFAKVSSLPPTDYQIIISYTLNWPLELTMCAKRNAFNQIENIHLPAEQTVAGGQRVDPKAMLMIGQSNNINNIQFKNICAYVKVTPEFDCNSIVFKSNHVKHKLAGIVTADYNAGAPTTSLLSHGTNRVTLSGDISANHSYYIAVLPETIIGGFTLIFKTSDGDYEKSTTQTLELTRNHVTNLGSFAKSDLVKSTTTGTAKRAGGIDVNWVQLWEDGPKFAVCNVGAQNNAPEDFGIGYYWSANTATSEWGINWRMPEDIDFEELIDNCICTWTEDYGGTGVNGLLCTGKENTSYAENSIFLPGGCETHGDYWTSTLRVSQNMAYFLHFYNKKTFVYYDYFEWRHGIRPILAR